MPHRFARCITAILWLLFAAPGFVGRRIRIKCGQCPACGYDLRGQPPMSTTKPAPSAGGELLLPSGVGVGLR